jgi:uracil-DNA glycosylase
MPTTRGGKERQGPGAADVSSAAPGATNALGQAGNQADEQVALRDLLGEVRSCRFCADLPLGPRPVLRASATAKLLIVGQAPGTRVHASGIPWDDPSGDRLRDWLGLEREIFYDETRIAIVPMGFCYPGRGRAGDLPPRPACAPRWHGRILALLPALELILLVGRYAQEYYLGAHRGSLAARIRDWPVTEAHQLPLVHPSPRNRRWLKANSWFEAEIVPAVRRRVAECLSSMY